MNKVILIGRLTANPEYKQTSQGTPTCRFTVAVNRPYQKDKQQESDFITCQAWRNTADFVSRYFSKGKPIIVEGSLRNNNYTDKNGINHYGIDVLVESVEFTINDNSQQQVQSQPRPSVANCQNQQRTYAQQNTNSRPPIPTYPSNQQPVATSYQQPLQQAQANQSSDVSDFEEILSDGDIPF
mgnify:CR=1 FL=1|jgi:single-strand DNA-binding protein